MAIVNRAFEVLPVMIFLLADLHSAAGNPPVVSKFLNCSNNTSSCSSQFLNSRASHSDCLVMTVTSSECKNWKFEIDRSSALLGTVKLKIYPYDVVGYSYSVPNITFTDIRWTGLRFRFKQHGYNRKHFCREFQISPEFYIPELFFDCLWTQSEFEGSPFIFEYEARNAQLMESRRYSLKLPYNSDISGQVKLKDWTAFIYVDISELPVLTARWQQAPLRYGIQKYRVELFSSISSDSESVLQDSAVIEGTDIEDEQLTYRFDTIFPTFGYYHFEVSVMSDICINGLCTISKSPKIAIDDFRRTLVIAVVGFVVFIPLFMLFLHMWGKYCQPSEDIVKKPVVLIVYTPSRASHLKCIVELTKYLRKHCFIDALLDQLDIQNTETEDPFLWYNEAFARADFVMVASSPPKCCKQEGIFRNVDVVALRLLMEKFSHHSTRPRFFSVLLPYCTVKDIPNEAKNFRMFKLRKDLDKMLWYMHYGGKLPTIIDSFRILLGPTPKGGKADLNVVGAVLLTAMKEAEYDLAKVCDCKKFKVEKTDNEDDENTTVMKLLEPASVMEVRFEQGKRCRNISDSNSTDGLLVNSLPVNEDSLPETDEPFSINDLNLSGDKEIEMEPVKFEKRENIDSEIDINTLEL